MTVLSYRKALETVQRRGAIRICSAYRTLSQDAVQVIAGVPPIELLDLERGERQRGSTKADTRARLLQDKWHNQALSAHGCFGKYLHFFVKKEDERCWYCEEDDSPEHTLFRSCRWVERKHEAEAELGVLLEPENVISEMLKSVDSWNIVAAYISEVLLSNEEDERRLQSNIVIQVLFAGEEEERF
ncbi:PREDICTED: uncharacterized protein LOC108561635 [Nicrophorus vespilloides]|uniref:Uncharacterized protein LOC108561635 n=1 Tax=Nicrophorus vespilloides TaxID=110193 RepID=A0ABM1MKQ2_NICVS|nr:PREDICTED: uncharacterized protein LOC108561635 [Nicrophorus vespilloides]